MGLLQGDLLRYLLVVARNPAVAAFGRWEGPWIPQGLIWRLSDCRHAMSKTILVSINTYKVWNMELRQIRYFQRVAAELSFTRAARALHMAQPPLSRQIKMLEEEIGVELFERAGRGIRLTDAGRYFLDQTDLMMQKLSETVLATQRI